MIASQLAKTDPIIFNSIEKELNRQKNQIELIASENFTLPAVMQAQGSVLTNKYAEGYPGRRYYGGCEFVDEVENLAKQRLQKLFACKWSNVQSHSGSQANQAVLLALVKPGDTIMGMDLQYGGHLTHGSSVNLSGKWFNIVSYGCDDVTGLIDMNRVEEMAKKHRPKIIIVGASAYPRKIDFKAFRAIADSIDAYLHADIAHYAGLIASQLYPSPVGHAHVITSTTHKTLRGPRGGIIMGNDLDLEKKINSAVFPGLQGGPLMHVIAAKAVAFQHALSDEFKQYSQAVIDNAHALSTSLKNNNVTVYTGGTDCHMVMVSLLEKYPQISGAMLEQTMERAGMTCNKNSVPLDPRSPQETSGIRLGSPAATTRGMGIKEFTLIGQWIAQIIHTMSNNIDVDPLLNEIRAKTQSLCDNYPLQY